MEKSYKPTLKTRIKLLLKRILCFCPIQSRKIVFVNYHGKGYGDNPKYIAEEIIRQRLPWRMIWLVNREDPNIPSQIKQVGIDSVAAFYELSTARFLISNCKNNIPYYYITRKKKKQFYLQTWHGDFGPKYIEKEIEDALSLGYLTVSKADSAATNAVLSGNEFFSEVLKKSFWLPEYCEILEYGVPRNDIYFRGNEFRNQLKYQFGFSLEDRILLYAPTFRDDDDPSCYSIDMERLIGVLSQCSHASWKVIVRLHPNVSSKTELFSFNERVIDGSVWPDQQELCLVSDCLITDYSSIFADFLLMRKPVFLFATDLEKYADRQSGRGLRDLYYHLPFSLSRNQQELEKSISEFNEGEYRQKENAFLQEYYRSFDDGHASERVVNYLKSLQWF